jgi:hypothetical protein
VKLTTYLHVVPRIKMRGSKLLLAHTPSRRGAKLSTGNSTFICTFESIQGISIIFGTTVCPKRRNMFTNIV